MRSAVKAVGGRVALIPWVMFFVTAMLTAIGAASPAACAIIGPIALGFAARYRISPLMMGMMVVHGAQAGGFSPISIYGTITNSVMEGAGLPSSEIAVFLASLIVNFILAVLLFVLLGGRSLMSKRLDPEDPDTLSEDLHRGGATIPQRGYGTTTATTTQNLGVRHDLLLAPNEHKEAVKQIAWPTVLLVAGVSTFATILTTAKAPEFVGAWAAGLGAALFVAALAVSSTIVDVSPFSTNGALMLANRPDTIEEPLYYKQVLTYSVIVTLVGPLLVWAALVLPGW